MNLAYDKTSDDAVNKEKLKYFPAPQTNSIKMADVTNDVRLPFEEDMLLSAVNLGESSSRFQKNKVDFYESATPEQWKKAKQVLDKLYSVINMPPNLKFRMVLVGRKHLSFCLSHTGDLHYSNKDLTLYYEEAEWPPGSGRNFGRISTRPFSPRISSIGREKKRFL